MKDEANKVEEECKQEERKQEETNEIKYRLITNE